MFETEKQQKRKSVAQHSVNEETSNQREKVNADHPQNIITLNQLQKIKHLPQLIKSARQITAVSSEFFIVMV